MKLYQCDWCEKQKGCNPMVIDGRSYDICAECRSEISNKLKGKGEQAESPLAEIQKFAKREHPWEPRHPQFGWEQIHPLLQKRIDNQRERFTLTAIQASQNLM